MRRLSATFRSDDCHGPYLFEEQADLIVALLRADRSSQSVPVRRGTKRLPGKNPLPDKK